MGNVFEFDDDENLQTFRRNSTITNPDLALADLSLDSIVEESSDDRYQLPTALVSSCLQLDSIVAPSQTGGGAASKLEKVEPSCMAKNDEATYEVKLGKTSFISSSVTTASVDFESGKKQHKVSLDDFEIIKLLGRGAYGKVILCRHIATDQLYAMKVLKKASLMVHAKSAERTKAERQILEELRHPFIVQLMFAFQTNERLYLILEYAPGGELFTHMNIEYQFSEDAARFYLAELVLALEHIHSLGVIYRDLKPENCLLDSDGHILLTDFGLSKVSLDGKAKTLCGTLDYSAPEILMGMTYDFSVDYWTLGILMYEMLTGYTPFRSANKNKTLEAIQKNKIQVPYYISNDAKDLLNQLLRKNPNVRLGNGKDGAQHIKSHGFFRKVNWKKLKSRQLAPPINPVVTDPVLAENFDEKFTEEMIKNTPIDSQMMVLDSDMQAYFENFSYVSRSYLNLGEHSATTALQ